MVECKSCGKCCSYVTVEIKEPKNKEECDEIIWWLNHNKVCVYVPNKGEWLLEFQSKCKFLSEDNMCNCYEIRPDICRKYSPHECEHHVPIEQDCKFIFQSSEEFIEYAKSKGLI